MANYSPETLVELLKAPNVHKYGLYAGDFQADEIEDNDSALLVQFFSSSNTNSLMKHTLSYSYRDEEIQAKANKKSRVLEHLYDNVFEFKTDSVKHIANLEILEAKAIERTDVSDKFEELKDIWIAETCFLSSFSERILNFNYQRIIGLGKEVLPFLIKDLKENQNDWFWALECITGEAPYTEDDRGNIPAMIEKWLAWAESKNIIK